MFSFIVYSSPLRFMSNNNKRQRNHNLNCTPDENMNISFFIIKVINKL